MNAKLQDLIDFKMPTEEELRRSSAGWVKRVGPTLIDQWPKELLALSAPTIFIEMPRNSVNLFEIKTFHDIADVLAVEIDAKIGWDRKFFRLNSRSPKDAPWPFEPLVSCSGKEIVSVLASSERVLDDLCYFSHSDATPFLCLREFWPMVNFRNEYRCFIMDGKVLAVAEYMNRLESSFDTPTAESDITIRAAIDAYLTKKVIPRLHIKTVVVDIVAVDGLRLLEINPYGLSDPVGARSYEAIEQEIPSIARLPRKDKPK